MKKEQVYAGSRGSHLILVLDGVGLGAGQMLCSIGDFKYAEVDQKSDGIYITLADFGSSPKVVRVDVGSVVRVYDSTGRIAEYRYDVAVSNDAFGDVLEATQVSMSGAFHRTYEDEAEGNVAA